MKFRTTIICLVFGMSVNGLSQTLLDSKLEGKTRFFEMMEIVNTHYDSLHRLGIEALPGERRYKHWKRWEWYMSQHLLPDGSIADIGKRLYRESELLRKKEQSQPQDRNTNPGWQFVGPSSTDTVGIEALFLGLGRVDRIAFHPTSANTIYIGTPGGGLWKTTDGGSSWNPMTDYLPAIGISGVAVHPSNGNIVYVLTGDGDTGLNTSAGVYVTFDGGTTWRRTSEIDTIPLRPYKLRINPDNPQVMWVATFQGLYRSLNGGYSWTKVRSGRFFDVILHPTNPAIVYASGWSEVVYSTNNGDMFTPATFDFTPIGGRKGLAVSPDDPSVVYVLASPRTGAGTFNGFYKSTNSGVSYTRQTTTPNLFGRDGTDNNDQSFIDIAVVASPTDADLVLTGGLIIFRSTTSGTNFTAVTSFGENGDPWYVHPDVHALEYNPLNGTLYAATDGGLYKSSDDGDTWTNLSEGIETTMFYNLAGYAGDETFLLGGTMDNGVKHRKTDDAHFWHIDCCDGFDAAFDPNTSDRMYASLNIWLSRYTSNGTVKTNITPKSHWFMRVATHVSISNIVFAGTADRMYRSFNAGSTWDTVFVEANDGIEMCPSNPNRMYIAGAVGGTKRFHRTDNLGVTFDRLDDNPGFPEDSQYIRGIAVHPDDADKVWVSFVGFTEGVKVYYSDDAGANWMNWSYSLPNVPVTGLEARSNGDLFAATDIGVFYKPATYADWIPMNNGLPRCAGTEFVINESAGLIRVGTYGRGIWEASIPNGSCNNSWSWIFNSTLGGYRYYEADSYINTNFILTGGANTEIYLKAGNYINLNEGFEAPATGNIFQAEIGPCTSGGIPNSD